MSAPSFDYNIIQWVDWADAGFAYADAQIDPRTGEILHAQIFMTSVFAFSGKKRAKALLDRLLAHKEHSHYSLSDKTLDELIEHVHSEKHSHKHSNISFSGLFKKEPMCNFEPSKSMVEGLTHLIASTEDFDDSVYLKASQDYVTETIAHEVGHTIGLSHNFISSARNRKSVMDYPHPLIKFSDNKIDLSDAYDHGIGDWDKLAINWGYRQFDSDEKNQLNKILQEGYDQDIYFISDQDSRPASSAHPRSHLWDNGFDAADELNRMLDIRRHVLDNFLDRAIKDGEPMSSIEEVLVPMYLLHRYQIEAAAKVVGGLEYNYALKGDGQVVTKMLPRDQQMKALNSLLNSIDPKNLSLPEKLIALIPPRAFGYPRTRETFNSRTGLTFDYLAAAETATNLTLKMLLNPDRASRLLTLKARNNNNQPGLTVILNEVINKTILNNLKNTNKNARLSNVEMEISKMVNHNVLNHLFMLANSTKTHQEVNARVNNSLVNLKNELNNKTDNEYHYRYLSSKIDSFLAGKVDISFPDELTPPDGSPIGSFMHSDLHCGSEL